MKRTLIGIVITLGLAAPVSGQVPNKLAVVEKVAAADPARFECAHTSRSCTYDFVKALACELHAADPRFGLNGRRGNPDPNQWSWDALNFCGSGPAKDPTGACAGALTVIDVIASAGAPGARPVWQAFTSDPTPGAWIQPVCKPVPPCPPAKPCPSTVIPGYAGDAAFDAVGSVLFADYLEAAASPDAGMGRWFARTIYDWIAGNTKTLQASIEKHRKEWRAALGLKD